MVSRDEPESPGPEAVAMRKVDPLIEKDTIGDPRSPYPARKTSVPVVTGRVPVGFVRKPGAEI